MSVYLTLFLNRTQNLSLIENLSYPKELIHLRVFSKSNLEFNVTNYLSFQFTKYSSEQIVREESVIECLELDCDFYLTVSDDFQIIDQDLIQHLQETGYQITCPKMNVLGKYWSNFWGQIDENGFYRRSDDYLKIVNREKVGTFFVPYVSGIYLVQKEVFPELICSYTEGYEPDKGYEMCFCENMRERAVGMFVDNRYEYGFMLSEEITLFSFNSNRKAWEDKYLHPDYKSHIQEVCGDVFLFPLFSQAFCQELIDLSEESGLWSDGTHDDPRIGGYENHPTVDIHMNQLKLGEIWEQIVKEYVAPICSELFSGYQTKETNISFIVKYSMDGQKDLSPHHDASTYTLNVALNDGYEGGGCRFIRQEYDLKDIKPGYATIHPGRLTHYHQGLELLSGERYILVSFII